MTYVAYTDKQRAEKKGKFLAALAGGASGEKAATAAGIGRKTAYRWRDEDKDFAADWDDAIEAGTDLIEDEIYRRAVTGVDKPVFFKGEVVGHVREYSDTLLIFMAKARRPEKYTDRAQIEHTGAVKVEIVKFSDDPAAE